MKPVIHRRAFDRAAAHYSEHAVLQAEVGERLLERLDHFQPEADTILDLGCGARGHAAALGHRIPGARVVSLDWSQAMLEQHPYEPGRNWPLQADFHRLPLANTCVDLVFANLSLSWSSNPPDAFNEIRRILRPGGLFMFSLYGPDTLGELHAAWAAADEYPHVNAHADMHDIGDGLIGAGFRDPVMDRDYLTLEYRNLDGLLEDLKGVGSQVVDPRQRRSLMPPSRLQAMKDAYAQYAQEGRFPATFELVFGATQAPREGQPMRSEDGEVAMFSVDSLRGSGRK